MQDTVGLYCDMLRHYTAACRVPLRGARMATQRTALRQILTEYMSTCGRNISQLVSLKLET